MALLSLSRVSLSFGGLPLLDDVELHIERGDRICLLGANGAGKSTLLRTISGVLHPRRGRVLFEGKPIDHMPTHLRVTHGISMVPEGRRVFPSLTVKENLEIGGYRKRTGPWTEEKIFDLFPLLVPLRKRQASSLSGGEQQALAIGRSLMSNPKLILMDEVSLGLAPVVIRRIYDAFQTLLDSGSTILVVEQDVQHVLTVATHVACFLEGRIALQGAPSELTNEQITAAYFGV